MSNRRMMSLGVLSLVTVPWALAMSVLGLWLISPEGSAVLPGVLAEPAVSGFSGVSALACGQLVFMVCVCDRVFPRASRRLVILIEGLTGLVFVGVLAGLGVLLLGDPGLS